MACIHSQLILHGNNWNTYNEVGTELTLPNNNMNINIIEHIETKEIDILQLKKYKKYCMTEWMPTLAII